METRDIELMLMRTWPAIEERTYDGWVLRFSRGYTKRSNCINPLYESYFDLEEKFEYCRKIYKENNLSFNLHIFTSGIVKDEMYFVIKTNIFKKVCNFFRVLVIS